MVRPEELVAALNRRNRQELEAQKLRADALRTTVGGLARTARSLNQIQRAWLIGSLAGGNFGRHSDVDVVVEGTRGDVRAELWAQWSKALDAPLDLLRYEELDDAFRARVINEGLLLQ